MHYVTEILLPWSEWRTSDVPESDRKLIVHTNKTRPDTARLSVEFFKDNGMKTTPHSPDSPGIAPSDFRFSGHVKGCLADRSFVDVEELFEAVREVLESIAIVTLQMMFLEWMERLRECIQTNGEYTE
jgi:hypothetical protein